MSTYRVQLPEDAVAFLTQEGTGPLATIADHVRDGAEYDSPGWTYLDEDVIRALRDLPEHHDGVLAEDSIFFGGESYPVEYVSER